MKSQSLIQKLKSLLLVLILILGHTNLQAQCNLTAGYTYTLGPNGQVFFTSTSTGTNSNTIYRWNLMTFPNAYGIFSGTALSTYSFTFPNNTTYNIYHVVATTTPSYCADSVLHSIAVTNATCSATTNFTLQQVPNQNSTWNGLVNYPSNVTAASWYWGDGNTSTGLYPSHTYASPGYYNVCLSLTISCGSVFTACTYSNLNKPNGNAQQNQIVTLNIIQGAPTAVNQLLNQNDNLTIFPNPNNSNFSISLGAYSPGSNLQLRITNLLGNEVYSDELQVQNHDESKSIDLHFLSSGTYFAILFDGKTCKTSKIFINKD